MRHYETIFIASPTLTDEQADELVKQFEGIIAEQGGELLKTDKWGRKKLAYEVQKFSEGYYTLFEMNAGPTLVAELERRLMQADKLSSIGLLAAGVAHEVNTPLAVISTYAQMLAKQISADDQKAPLLEKIARQTSRASEIDPSSRIHAIVKAPSTSPSRLAFTIASQSLDSRTGRSSR